MGLTWTIPFFRLQTMRILVFGSTGMLGHKLVQILGESFETFSTVRGDSSRLGRYDFFDPARVKGDVDVTRTPTIRSAVDWARPDVVINAAGVIKQVSTARSVVPTLLINSIFPHRLAELSSECGFRLITISTDCVFSGSRGNYRETDTADALDLYGKSKEFGEVDYGNSLTLRTSIIGRELETTNGLVEWFLSNRGKRVNGFTKAIFSGLPTLILAELIQTVITEHPDLHGLYHVSSDPISKFDLLDQVDRAFSTEIEIVPSEDLIIDRSLNSERFRHATGFKPLGWPEMIERMKTDRTPYEKLRS